MLIGVPFFAVKLSKGIPLFLASLWLCALFPMASAISGCFQVLDCPLQLCHQFGCTSLRIPPRPRIQLRVSHSWLRLPTHQPSLAQFCCVALLALGHMRLRLPCRPALHWLWLPPADLSIFNSRRHLWLSSPASSCAILWMVAIIDAAICSAASTGGA